MIKHFLRIFLGTFVSIAIGIFAKEAHIRGVKTDFVVFLSLRRARVQLHLNTLSLFKLFTDGLRAQKTSLSLNFSPRFGLRVILGHSYAAAQSLGHSGIQSPPRPSGRSRT